MQRAALWGIALVCVLAVASCNGGEPPRASNGYAVPAVREPLTNDSASPVVHDLVQGETHPDTQQHPGTDGGAARIARAEDAEGHRPPRQVTG
jgi:hypothetical protein